MSKDTAVLANSLGNSTLLDTDEGLAALDLFANYPDGMVEFGAACCIIFMLIGIPGNLITIISLARYKKVRNATAIFIINLSCADFLFCCINLPLAATTFLTKRWYLGASMCKFFPFARVTLAGVSLFTILAITTNRYIMISHPSLYVRFYTKRNLGIIVAFTWIISIVSLIPTYVGAWGRFGMDIDTSFCVILTDENGNTPKKFLFTSAFVIPFITITVCYIRIFYLVRKATINSRNTAGSNPRTDAENSSIISSDRSPEVRIDSTTNDKSSPPEHPRVQSLRPPSTPRVKILTNFPTEQRSSSSIGNILNVGNINLRKSLDKAAPTSKDKRLLTLISAIVITFFVFYLPITIIEVCHEVAVSHKTMIVWSYLMRYFTTSCNPLIYVVMSHEYRKAYKKAFVAPSCGGKCCNFWR